MTHCWGNQCARKNVCTSAFDFNLMIAFFMLFIFMITIYNELFSCCLGSLTAMSSTFSMCGSIEKSSDAFAISASATFPFRCGLEKEKN